MDEVKPQQVYTLCAIQGVKLQIAGEEIKQLKDANVLLMAEIENLRTTTQAQADENARQQMANGLLRESINNLTATGEAKIVTAIDQQRESFYAASGSEQLDVA